MNAQYVSLTILARSPARPTVSRWPRLPSPPPSRSESPSARPSRTARHQAGGHPDIVRTSRSRIGASSGGGPKISPSMHPEGLFGNPTAISVHLADFAFNVCPALVPAGPDHGPGQLPRLSNYLLGTAPIYDRGPGRKAACSFIVPTLNIPIAIPSVRTGPDYGLHFTVSDITQRPSRRSRDDVLGLPGRSIHDRDRFAKGARAIRRAARAKQTRAASPERRRRRPSRTTLTDNPNTCTGERLPIRLDVETYQDPGVLSHGESSRSADRPNAKTETFKPSCCTRADYERGRLRLGLDFNLQAQIEGSAASPSDIGRRS